MSEKTENEPTVSVVIAAYNAAETLGETLASVLGQTWRDYEVIVVDDGSTDATAAVVERLAQSAGPPIRYLHQENKGQPAARNAGIRAARGRYVAFLDADDLWLPEKLARQMRLHAKRPDLAWSYTDAFLFASETGRTLFRASQENELPEGDVLRALLLGNFILSPTPIVQRSVFEEVGFFNEDPGVRNGEDWEMWLRIGERAPLGLVRAPLARVRLHARRMSQTVDLRYALRSRLRILAPALRRNPDAAHEVRRQAVGNVYAAIGRWALEREERPEARRLFAKALRCAPASRYIWAFWLATWLPRPALRVLGALRRLARSAEQAIKR